MLGASLRPCPAPAHPGSPWAGTGLARAEDGTSRVCPSIPVPAGTQGWGCRAGRGGEHGGVTGVSPGCHRGSLRQGGAADRPVPEGDGGARGQRQGAAAALHRGAAGPRRPRREAAPDHQQQLRHHPQREPGALRHPGHQGHRPTGTSAGTGTGTASGTRPRLRESTLGFGNAPSASGMGSQLRERAPGFRNSPSASGTRPRLSSARGPSGAV